MHYSNFGDELYHYGVKGMRWGVRKGYEKIASNASSITRSTKDAVSTVGKGKAYDKAKKDVSKMTDQELKDRVKRMNLEEQYRNLSVNNTSRGRSFVESALSVGGSVLAATSSALAIALAIKELRK